MANYYLVKGSNAVAVVQTWPQALRICIEMGRCPFGISWRSNDRSGYKIPTLAFFSWLTKGTVPVEL